MFNESVCELEEGGDEIVREVRVPMERWTLKVGAETLTHTCFTLFTWYGGCEYTLLVGHDVIHGISHAVIHLHIRKEKKNFLGISTRAMESTNGESA